MGKVFGRKALGTLAVCIVIGLSSASLSGCGFAPLYAQTGLTTSLSQVEVVVPQTRTGYFLEQDLRNGLGSDDTSRKAYKLIIRMKENHYSVGYKVDDTSTRSEITTAVSYVLKDSATGNVLLTNNLSETVTYDTSTSPFAGVISQQDAQKRVSTAISQQIQRDLALYFHGGVLPAKTVSVTPSLPANTSKATSSTTADTVPAGQ